MFEVIVKDRWDEDFFNEFIKFKNEVHKNIPTSFPDSLGDLSKFFSDESLFANDFEWKAIMIKRDHQVVAKAVLTKKIGSINGNLGFLDWINDLEVANSLIKKVEEEGKLLGLKMIKTPIDFNFFVKYRIKLPNGGDPFYGEPVYPDYYHDLFKATGFKIIGEWKTYKLNRIKSVIEFARKRFALSKGEKKKSNKDSKNRAKVRIRNVSLKRWESELKVIYDLFSEAYKNMPEFELISFEQFKLIYSDFRYIVNPLHSYIVESDNIPVAFSINYIDPLPLLLPLKNKKVSNFDRVKFFIKQRLNSGSFLVSHVGKISSEKYEVPKGLIIQLSKRVSIVSSYASKILITFRNINSPAQKPFNPNVESVYSEYVLYGKEL